MEEILNQLAVLNYSGAPFLLAYGITWSICGWIWMRFRSFIAALITLFQGMAALPAALLVMFLIGAFEQRPDTGILNDLVIIISMSQLLALPLLVAIYRKKHFTFIPFVFSLVGAVHFLMYTWLYQTPAYIVMAVLISLVLSVIYGRKADADGISTNQAAAACFATGLLLILNAFYLIGKQVI